MLPMLLAVAVAAQPHPSALKVFGGWIVACDNGRACGAVALLPSADEGSGFASLEIDRKADGAAAPQLMVVEAPDSVVALKAAGTRIPLPVDKSNAAGIRPADAPAVIEALRSVAALELLDGGGKIVARISAKGASAALLYMDDAQKRLGTVTALARPGARPASAVPPPPPLPVLVAAPRSAKAPARFGPAVWKKLLGDNACKPGDERKDQPPTFARLDDTHTLVLVTSTCTSGAYNYDTDIELITDAHPDDPDAADLEPIAHETEEDGVKTMNADWDAKAHVLHTGFKGRGFGDCGTWRDYVWDGRRFRLSRQSEMGECRGGIDPITTWRTDVRSR